MFFLVKISQCNLKRHSLFSDWKIGERSPVKVSLVLMAGIKVLALVIVLQG